MTTRLVPALLLTASLAAFAAGPPKSGDARPEAVKAAAAANNAFAPEMHRALAAKGGNVVFSPWSITTALNMAAAGAKGETLDEFAAVLRHPKGGDVHLANAGLLGAVAGSASKGIDVRAANGLWGPEEYNKAFVDLNRDYYGAAVRKIALVGAEPTINKWVEDNTEKRIKDLFAPRSFTVDTKLVLTNAVYFKGTWATVFDEKLTKKEPFHAPAGKVEVPTMRTPRPEYMRYVKKDGFVAAEKPYKGGKLSMVVIRPDAKDGLAAVEKALDLKALTAALATAEAKRVDLRLPRFKIEGEATELAAPLKAMGLRRAFERGRADFSGVVASPPLFISSVVHKAFVEVNEVGTEAAAATGIVMEATSLPPPPVDVVCDRPFLFAIRHVESGAVLFLGRVEKP